VLLAGVSAYLVAQRCSTREVSRFLFTRGLWLAVLEVTLISVLWTFNFRFELGLIMQVVWAIGLSMIVLSGLVYLPVRLVGAIGVAICLFHNLLDGVPMPESPVLKTVWAILHVQSPVAIGYVHYPLIPWVGVMASGYALGSVFQMEAGRRQRVLIALGASMVALFLALRLINAYGDPVPWTAQSDYARTLMSFMNVKKYPPSLDYLLMTLGPALIVLGAVRFDGPRLRFLVVFGQVPLLFYVLHLFVLRFASLPVAFARFGALAFAPPPRGTGASPELPLFVTYLAWLVTLALLYPVCRRYAELKATKRRAWMSYL